MSRHRSAPFVLLAAALFLSGCYVAPKPVYRLTPLDSSAEWHLGRQIVRAGTDSVAIAVTFRRHTRWFEFDVDITNRGSGPVLVAPERFHYIVLDAPEAAVTADAGRFHAVDPESMLVALDKEASREEARYASAVLTDATFAVVELADDIASAGEERTPQEAAAEEADDIEDDVHRIRRDGSHESRMSHLENARYEWSETTLRKTTLHPARYIDGRVFFPVRNGSGILRLVFPIGDAELSVDYAVEPQ